MRMHELGCLDPNGNSGYMSKQLRHCVDHHAGTSQAKLEALGEHEGGLCFDDNEIGPEHAHVVPI